MTVPGISPAITSIQNKPGHPFISLWADGGASTPLVITIVPSWFADNGGLIAYVPGELPPLPNIYMCKKLQVAVAITFQFWSHQYACRYITGAEWEPQAPFVKPWNISSWHSLLPGKFSQIV